MIVSKLTKIVDKLVRKFLQNKEFDEHYVEEAFARSLTEMIVQILGGQQVGYDFWEVNFYLSFERLTRNRLRKNTDEAKLDNNFSN